MPERPTYESEARAVEREQTQSIRGGDVRAPAPTSGERLHRRRRTADPLYFDKKIVPGGMSYEWKRDSLLGRPESRHWIGLRENHWSPVPPERHPEMAVEGESVIRVGDVVLCERPKYLTDEAKMEDMQEALHPVQQVEEVMYGDRANEMTRNHPSVRKSSFVKQEFAPGTPGDPSDRFSSEP